MKKIIFSSLLVLGLSGCVAVFSFGETPFAEDKCKTSCRKKNCKSGKKSCHKKEAAACKDKSCSEEKKRDQPNTIQ